MRWGRVIAAGTLALGAGFMLTGCLFFAGMDISKYRVKPGKSTVVTVRVLSGTDEAPNYPLFALLVPEDGSVRLGKATWNTNGALGDSTVPMVQDPNVAARITAEDRCADTDLGFINIDESAETKFVVVRTKSAVNLPKIRRPIEAEVRLKVPAGTPTGVRPFFLAAGEWNDDGDQVAEDTNDDGYFCISGSSSAIDVRK